MLVAWYCGTIPAIAVTAFAGAEDLARALGAGYQAHLSKPIHADDLVMIAASFAQLLGARRSTEQVPWP